jgi:hypothetical protein
MVAVPIIVINNTRAERIACGKAVEGYRHDDATVEQARAYSRCIDRLHPSPMSPHDAIALKVVIVVILLGMVAGVVLAWEESPLERFFAGPLMGALVAFVFCAVAAGIFFGVRFLFS